MSTPRMSLVGTGIWFWKRWTVICDSCENHWVFRTNQAASEAFNTHFHIEHPILNRKPEAKE